jgi:hypothetical protein
VLLDEQDEAFLADWAAADAEARTALHSMLAAAGQRPLPAADLRAAVAKLRGDIAQPGWPGQMLVSFSGRNAESLPSDDAELWLTLATSVAAPQGGPLSDEDKEFARAMEWAEEEDLEFGDDLDEESDVDEPDELSAAIAAVCALDHFDWLAVMSALVTGGPGTPASAADLARYVRDFDPEQVIGLAVVDNDFSFAPAVAAVNSAEADADDYLDVEVEVGVEVDDDDDFDKAALLFEDADFGGSDDDDDEKDEDEDEDFDELSIEELFLNVTAMWSVLGAIDSDDRLTPLGWWGLPEAMSRAWTEPEAE